MHSSLENLFSSRSTIRCVAIVNAKSLFRLPYACWITVIVKDSKTMIVLSLWLIARILWLFMKWHLWFLVSVENVYRQTVLNILLGENTSGCADHFWNMCSVMDWQPIWSVYHFIHTYIARCISIGSSSATLPKQLCLSHLRLFYKWLPGTDSKALNWRTWVLWKVKCLRVLINKGPSLTLFRYCFFLFFFIYVSNGILWGTWSALANSTRKSLWRCVV